MRSSTIDLRQLLLGLAALCACMDASDELAAPPVEEDMPAFTECDTDGTGTTTGCPPEATGSEGDAPMGATELPCQASFRCDGGICAASFDAERERPDAFICRSLCVETMDETTWCRDDAACCDAQARCSPRGYCIAEPDTPGTSTSGEGEPE